MHRKDGFGSEGGGAMVALEPLCIILHGVRSHVAFQIALLIKSPITNGTLVGLDVGMRHDVPFQVGRLKNIEHPAASKKHFFKCR